MPPKPTVSSEPTISDMQDEPRPEFDFARMSAGVMPRGTINGAPVHFLLWRLYDKAKVPKDHALRAGLVHTHGSHAGKDGVEMLPDVFPPPVPGSDPPINSVLPTIQDWLDAVQPFTKLELPKRPNPKAASPADES